MMNQYKRIVDTYLLYNEDEVECFNTVYAPLLNKEENDLINRKNFIGHFTTSAFVLSNKR